MHPSLASSTGTRVDSAAKHTMACKVHTQLVKHWLANSESDADKHLHREKMRFCVHKDELVINVTHSMFPNKASVVSAYPLVISTLSEIEPAVLERLKWTYESRTPRLFQAKMRVMHNEATKVMDYGNDDLVPAELQPCFDAVGPGGVNPNPAVRFKHLTEADQVIKHQLFHMPQFNAQGYSLGTAYASQTSGDTVCTIFIGGMLTVMNGAFECKTGDLIQWYFPGEEGSFAMDTTAEDVNGARYDLNNRNQNNNKRKRYFDERNYGMEGYNNPNHKSRSVFRVKPYRLYKMSPPAAVAGAPAPAVAPPVPVGPEYVDYYGDKIRIFAKCIGGARPYEMMDIMLMTQSL